MEKETYGKFTLLTGYSNLRKPTLVERIFASPYEVSEQYPVQDGKYWGLKVKGEGLLSSETPFKLFDTMEEAIVAVKKNNKEVLENLRKEAIKRKFLF